jgi:hypothetical protein
MDYRCFPSVAALRGAGIVSDNSRARQMARTPANRSSDEHRGYLPRSVPTLLRTRTNVRRSPHCGDRPDLAWLSANIETASPPAWGTKFVKADEPS